jgi:hypothetical protein
MTYYYSIIYNPDNKEVNECASFLEFYDYIEGNKACYITSSCYCREVLVSVFNDLYLELHKMEVVPKVTIKVSTNRIDFDDRNIDLVNRVIKEDLFRYSYFKNHITADSKGITINGIYVNTALISLLLYIIDEHLDFIDRDLIPRIIEDDGRFEDNAEEAILTAFFYYCLRRSSIGDAFYIKNTNFIGPASYIMGRMYDLLHLFLEFYELYGNKSRFSDLKYEDTNLNLIISGVKDD